MQNNQRYENKQFYEKTSYCQLCQKPLPLNYEDELCPSCKDHVLFNQVKDFIRACDVNEYEVARHFDIPVQRVRDWIRQGRIQYKDIDVQQVTTLHCQLCGNPVAFGSLCPKCLKLQTFTGGVVKKRKTEEGDMRHLKTSEQE